MRSPLDSVSSDVMDNDDQNGNDTNHGPAKSKLADAAITALMSKKAGQTLKDSFKRRKESKIIIVL